MAARTSKVLVVDDDELLLEFYTRVLNGRGYEAVCAANGSEAITRLEQLKGDVALVILDLLMPVRTGWELIEYIRANDDYTRLPIIAITGLATSFEEFERVRQSCDEVLLKGDFELTRFNETVDRLAAAPSKPKTGRR